MWQKRHRFQGQFLVTRISREEASLGGLMGPSSKESSFISSAPLLKPLENVFPNEVKVAPDLLGTGEGAHVPGEQIFDW